MTRKNQTRHSNEKIQQALARVKGGESLTKVAESLGIAKSLIKYWKDRNIKGSPNPAISSTTIQINQRTRKFMDKCWVSMNLGFRQLQRELKKESPRAVKDLTLCVSILFDKLLAASQSLQSQVAPNTSQQWEASEETLMILQRHHQNKSPGEAPVEAQEVGLSAPELEREKKDTPTDPDPIKSEDKR